MHSFKRVLEQENPNSFSQLFQPTATVIISWWKKLFKGAPCSWIELPVQWGWLADFLWACLWWVEVFEAGGDDHFMSGTAFHKAGEQWQGRCSAFKQLCFPYLRWKWENNMLFPWLGLLLDNLDCFMVNFKILVIYYLNRSYMNIYKFYHKHCDSQQW